jgi:hypothetical protein
MKRATVLLASLLATVLLSVPTASGTASTTKPIRQVSTCGWVDYDEEISLIAQVQAGHWTDAQGRTVSACGYRGTRWHRSVDGFTETLRWYVGSTLVKKYVFRNPNTSAFPQFHWFSRVGIKRGAKPGTWKLHGALITAKITLRKKGFAPRTVVISRFSDAE